jgi:hypothetical protein
MTDDEWSENRILWRARKHDLLDRRCARFVDLPESVQEQIRSSHDFSGRPLLAFVGDNSTWTVVTTSEIVSFFDGAVVFGPVDAINNDIDYDTDTLPDSACVKRESTFLRLKSLGISVWVPEGAELHAL